MNRCSKSFDALKGAAAWEVSVSGPTNRWPTRKGLRQFLRLCAARRTSGRRCSMTARPKSREETPKEGHEAGRAAPHANTLHCTTQCASNILQGSIGGARCLDRRLVLQGEQSVDRLHFEAQFAAVAARAVARYARYNGWCKISAVRPRATARIGLEPLAGR